MITEKEYLQTVSAVNPDLTPFINIALNERGFRNILIKHLKENAAINIYYHSYMIIYEVSKTNPSLFFEYWYDFVRLLKHPNSYHRNYAMDLIANLISSDTENLFEQILDDYYKQLSDEKLVTIKHCIENSSKIIREKPQLKTIIISKIIESLRINSNTEKHQNFLISKFLKLISSTENNLYDRESVSVFLLTVFKNTKSEKIKREIKIYNRKFSVSKVDPNFC